MAINTNGGGRNGDLTGTSKKEKKIRLASFSPKQNAAVVLSKEQQSNGFKGESLNDHGLPDGHVQKEVDTPTYTGPKFREVGQKKDKVDKYAKYAKGAKSIMVFDDKKPKGDLEKPIPSKLESIEPITPAVLDNPLRPKAMELPKGNEADMQKVRDYQTKLNKKGAGLVVDGVWGDKTKAASTEYYNKYQKGDSTSSTTSKSSTKKTMKLPKGDTEFKSVTPTKLPGTPAAEDYFSKKNDNRSSIKKTNTKESNDYKSINLPETKSPSGKEVGKYDSNGTNYYPNGRAKTVDNEMTDIYTAKEASRLRKPKDTTNTSTGKMSLFLNKEGTKSLTIDERKKNIVKENNRVMKLSNIVKKDKDDSTVLDTQIKEARESGNTNLFNKLVNKRAGRK